MLIWPKNSFNVGGSLLGTKSWTFEANLLLHWTERFDSRNLLTQIVRIMMSAFYDKLNVQILKLICIYNRTIFITHIEVLYFNFFNMKWWQISLRVERLVSSSFFLSWDFYGRVSWKLPRCLAAMSCHVPLYPFRVFSCNPRWLSRWEANGQANFLRLEPKISTDCYRHSYSTVHANQADNVTHVQLHSFAERFVLIFINLPICIACYRLLQSSLFFNQEVF